MAHSALRRTGLALLALATVTIAAPRAEAQVSCQTYGTSTYCSNGQSFQS